MERKGNKKVTQEKIITKTIAFMLILIRAIAFVLILILTIINAIWLKELLINGFCFVHVYGILLNTLGIYVFYRLMTWRE